MSEAEKNGKQEDFMSKVTSLNDTADTTADFDAADIEKNKVMAVLAYIGLLVLIPIFAAKDSKFARYHSNQGLILCIVGLVWGAITGVVTGIVCAISLQLGGIIGGVLGAVSLVFLALAILGIVNAVNGKAKELPIIGKVRILK